MSRYSRDDSARVALAIFFIFVGVGGVIGMLLDQVIMCLIAAVVAGFLVGSFFDTDKSSGVNPGATMIVILAICTVLGVVAGKILNADPAFSGFLGFVAGIVVIILMLKLYSYHG